MNVKYKTSFFLFIIIFSIAGIQFLSPDQIHNQSFSEPEKSILHLSNSNMPDLIIFFNQSTFLSSVKTTFTNYGGQLKENEYF
ncbi:MAG: hypothetical protein ACTSR5_18445 [Promethearchaeota archaeon]